MTLYRYEAVISLIKERIATGTLVPGERLPSVRLLSKLTGYSPVTVHHAYELLESEGICHARPRSGFYVSPESNRLGDFPEIEATSPPVAAALAGPPEALLKSWRSKDLEAFGAFYPSVDLFNREEIDRTLRQVLRRGFERTPGSELPQGDIMLRQEIAKRAALRSTFVRHQDIIVVNSAMWGFYLCLDALTEPGDAVLVESPAYFPMVAALRNRDLHVVEIYSHPRTGINPEQFNHLLKQEGIRLAVLMCTHHYPTGVTYSEETMRRLVEIGRLHKAIILENDMFGDLNYHEAAAPYLKKFDKNDTVIQLGSFACSLSPDYGLGWIVGGRHTPKLMAQQFMSGQHGGDGLIQRALAEYLGSHSQDRQLRQLRATLAARMRRGIDLISTHFPRETAVSMPSGGFMCWVRAPQHFNANAFLVDAIKRGYSILPGSMFSVAESFANFIAFNFSFPWTPQNEQLIIEIGTALKATGSQK